MFHSYGMDFIGREITPLVRIERAIVLYPLFVLLLTYAASINMMIILVFQIYVSKQYNNFFEFVYK